jgi:hypothetical protein
MDASMPVEKLISGLVYLSGNAIAWLIYLFVAVRLYGLSRRTGQLPEFLIAVTFLLWTLAYLFYDIPYAIARFDEQIPAVFSYGSLIVLALGNVAFAFFIRAVFRPDARWATWLVAAITVIVVAGLAGSAWIGDWEGRNPLANPWYWLDSIGSFTPSVWMGAEGFAHYFKARRRLKLGLCEPMACNRFLLWGIAGALWIFLEAIITLNDLAYAFTGQWSLLLDFGVALFEAVPVTVVWFVFFPPRFYCRWVEGSGKPATAAPPTVD